MSETLRFTEVTGTLDELEPILRAQGYTAVRTMAGAIDLATFDPYGMRRVGSVNIQTERWAHHVYRGTLAFCGTVAYLADAKTETAPAVPPFANGLFELLTANDADTAIEAIRRCDARHAYETDHPDDPIVDDETGEALL